MRDAADPRELDRTWPGRSIRRPRRGDGEYLVYRAITHSLEDARDRHLQPPVSVLDVGASLSPYYPLFAGIASEYVGADLDSGPLVRWVCPVEELEAPDDAFDLVLCTQVLEHVRDPARGLEQMRRVLRPGGHLFLTTHGTWPHHPHPTDYWRWTQEGLRAICADAGLEVAEIVPHGGTVAALAGLSALYLDAALRKLRLAPLRAPLVALTNLAGAAGDRVLPVPRFPAPYTLIVNFLVVARKPPG